MSHFSVLCVGPNVEGQLTPYNEDISKVSQDILKFECVEEEYRKKYEKGTHDEFYCSSSSSWGMEVTQDIFDNINRKKIGEVVTLPVKKVCGLGGYWKKDGYYKCGVPKNHKCPKKQIWVQCVEIPLTNHPDKDVCFEGIVEVKRVARPKKLKNIETYSSFEVFMKEYAGHDSVDEKTGKYGYWTNPQGKWDWMVVGGRWAGHIKTKNRVEAAYSPNFSWGWDESAKRKRLDGRHVDFATKSDIDFDSMRSEAEKKAAADYDFVAPLLSSTPPHTPWSEIDHKKENSREEYWAQPRCVKWKELEKNFRGTEHEKYFGFDSSADDYLVSRETYIKDAGDSAFRTFALVIDGKWYAKGDMGMFATVSNEKEKDVWNKFFWETVNGLPDDTILTVVDCHV